MLRPLIALFRRQPKAVPCLTPPLPLRLQETYPPRLADAGPFEDNFCLALARPYNDHWATSSSLLASPATPIRVWVRNRNDELVAHYVCTSSPVLLGSEWWPGLYTVHVEHPAFTAVLVAHKLGESFWDMLMPPLDLLAPAGAPNTSRMRTAPTEPAPLESENGTYARLAP